MNGHTKKDIIIAHRIIMSTFSTTVYQSIEAEAKDIARLAKGGGGGNGALFFGLLATTAPQPAVRAAAESVVAGVRAVARHTDEKEWFETHEVGAFFVVVFVRRLDDDEDSRAFLEVVAETRKARRFLSLSLSLSSRASGRTRGGLMRLFCYVLEMRDAGRKASSPRRNISVFSFPFSFGLFLFLFRSPSRKLTRSLLLCLSLHAGCVGVVSLGDDERGIF